MFSRFKKWLTLTLLFALPIAAFLIYRNTTKLPDKITIAAGPDGGRYFEVANHLAGLITKRTGIEVEVLPTDGSRDNFELLSNGKADLILYQHGASPAENALADRPKEPAKKIVLPPATFVSNLYSEVVHFIIRRGEDGMMLPDTETKHVAIGLPGSGDFAIGNTLIKHMQWNSDAIQIKHLSYTEMQNQLASGKLDAAILVTGFNAPIYHSLLEASKENGLPLCTLKSIPFANAFATKHIAVSITTIPAGLYGSGKTIEPKLPIETLAIHAQLLANPKLSTRFVEEVTGIVLSEEFQKQAVLAELFSQGKEFAKDKPEFSLHPGAINVYDPNLKPLLNPDFVEATEGIRSFVVSILIAGYLFFRWWHERAKKTKEHRLDRYIRRVLEIEKEQLDYDQAAGKDDAIALQELLDKVTHLRQDALKEFTAHELSEDRAIDCFIEMCHALSDKINAKLTRQCLNAMRRENGLKGNSTKPTK